MRQMTAKGYDFLETEEGERLFSYDDATGKRIVPGDIVRGTLTIGVGHTGPDVFPGQTITNEESRRLFDQDTDWAEKCVEEVCVGPKSVTLRPNDNEFDAMVSLAFNIGEAAFRSSSVARMWNKGDRKAAGNAFSLWTKTVIDGQLQDHPVLIARRARETSMFFTPPAGVVPKPMPQAVENPAVVSSSKPLWTQATVGVGGAALVIENAKPAVEAVNSAIATAREATTAWAGVKDLLAPLLNGHVLTAIIAVILIGCAGYLIHRLVRRIRRGEVSA